jgi:hypothetical protein
MELGSHMSTLVKQGIYCHPYMQQVLWNEGSKIYLTVNVVGVGYYVARGGGRRMQVVVEKHRYDI